MSGVGIKSEKGRFIKIGFFPKKMIAKYSKTCLK